MENKLKEYQSLILGWAKDKNITGVECAPMQRLKAIEAWQKEFGIISFERLLMRKFIANWLQKASHKTSLRSHRASVSA